MLSKPQGIKSLGVCFFLSLGIHVGLGYALWLYGVPRAPNVLGSLLGAKKPGAEIYLQYARVAGAHGQEGAVLKQKPIVFAGGEFPSALSSMENQSLDNGDAPSTEPGATKNQAGWNDIAAPSIYQTGRQSGFLGPPSPSGDPLGKLPPQFDWAMRRQSFQAMLSAQIDFMRLVFPLEQGIDCLVDSFSGSCNYPDQRIIGFLSARFTELRLIDPSVKSMKFVSHGEGYWTYEIKE